MGEVENQNAVNYMTGKFQTLIKEFDDFRSFKEKVPVDISKLEKDFEAISETLKNLIKDCSAIDSKVASNEEKFRLQFINQDAVNHETKNAFKFQETKFEEHKLHITNNSERLKKVEDNQSKFADKVQIFDLQNGLKKLLDRIDAESLSLKSELKKSVEAQEKIYLAKNLDQVNINEILKTDIGNLIKEVMEVKKSFESHKSETAQCLYSLKASMNSQISEAIASIPKVSIPSLDEAKVAMKKEIEPASLDAKNANLRSTNNESEIKILKKQVESLTLIIKKFEIEGQK